ncbi:MFS transporter [bacterium M00.F.Ca.ET.228.01.1.1]|uniref:MFS transporter n=1 Tax=Paraburkholderia phenoliruptrix TaxID=252970 RepID=UPI001091C3D7|nr:MFS transporter [Paraburkholderia phenoliruptrix]TGP39932.1 MFS transporter [bacterium M00.F.Ca.ET.228.01.1.1]TGR95822.1 MFS transporter [bacterium M00.F.Ca.ET.191.01.1.1]TGT96876.1 MFS transporter [bacterium M00.F.Ca.ET.155.01.1.1]MBW0445837.1 MFS transporter [Paraburkholderia phenoliruptrix]MBW9101691.1 MFS transporter [Paraburkholderia phenoliruptrix]
MRVRSRISVLESIPRSVWVLGCVSLLMDVSSEIIHSLLPMFLMVSLGASAATIGLIEGIAEATAPIVKVFSGALSDYLGNRKWLAVTGYALGALSKPLFAIAPTVGVVVGARVIDRIGKGIRGAPRDALVADVTPVHLRGAAFGLRQSLDTIGAVLGPLCAVLIMLVWADNFRLAFWLAVIPGVLAVALLSVGIHEPARAPGAKRVNPIRLENLKKLGANYWWVVAIGGVFALARFSEAFLVLRAMGSGVPVAWVPLVMVAMNIVYSLSAYPFGKLADTTSHTRLLIAGLVVLIVADLVLANGNHWGSVLLGVALWGLHMGMTQGLLATMVSHTAPAQLRGTAFGFFNLLSGIVTLFSSVIAGELWDRLGAATAFYAGAVFCIATIVLLVAGKARDTRVAPR